MVGNFEKNGKEYLKVDNSAMTYMLINSVKEQQRLIESKDVKLAYLQNQLDELKSVVNSCCENKLSKNQNTITESSHGNLLFQNQPKPFNQLTIISFQIIKDANNPKILIRNLNGELVKSITTSQKGKGQVTVDASELKPGTYTYTLIVNNQSAAIAMELGCQGVLLNTAIAAAKDPLLMAEAMRDAVIAGRKGFLAGRMPKRLYAHASSPTEGLIG